MKYLEEYEDFLNEITFSGGKMYNRHKRIADRFKGIRVLSKDGDLEDREYYSNLGSDTFDSNIDDKPIENEYVKSYIKNAGVKIPKIKIISGFKPMTADGSVKGKWFKPSVLDKCFYLDIKNISFFSSQSNSKTKKLYYKGKYLVYGWLYPNINPLHTGGIYIVRILLDDGNYYEFNHFMIKNKSIQLKEKEMYEIVNDLLLEIKNFKTGKTEYIDPYFSTSKKMRLVNLNF